MSEEAKGPITGSVLALELMLSECPAFQDRVEAATAEAAKEKILLYGYEAEDPAELQAARPFASIWPGDRLDLEQIAGGQRIAMTCTGELVLLLTDVDRHPALADQRQSAYDFAGWVDEILVWLKEQSNAGGYLSVKAIRFLQGPTRSPRASEASQGAYWHCSLIVEWV